MRQRSAEGAATHRDAAAAPAASSRDRRRPSRAAAAPRAPRACRAACARRARRGARCAGRSSWARQRRGAPRAPAARCPPPRSAWRACRRSRGRGRTRSARAGRRASPRGTCVRPTHCWAPEAATRCRGREECQAAPMRANGWQRLARARLDDGGRLEGEDIVQQRELRARHGMAAVTPGRQLHLARHQHAPLRLRLRLVYRLLHARRHPSQPRACLPSMYRRCPTDAPGSRVASRQRTSGRARAPPSTARAPRRRRSRA